MPRRVTCSVEIGAAWSFHAIGLGALALWTASGSAEALELAVLGTHSGALIVPVVRRARSLRHAWAHQRVRAGLPIARTLRVLTRARARAVEGSGRPTGGRRREAYLGARR